MKEAKKYYLKCEISEGMFSNEKIVSFKDINGRDISGFWSDDCLKNGLLEVQLIDSEKDKSLITGPFSASSGYGFFQGNFFYVDNNLISDSFQIPPAIAPVDHQGHHSYIVT